MTREAELWEQVLVGLEQLALQAPRRTARGLCFLLYKAHNPVGIAYEYQNAKNHLELFRPPSDARVYWWKLTPKGDADRAIAVGLLIAMSRAPWDT